MFTLFLVIISAILTGLSFNLPNYSFLIWFSLAPFLYIVKTKEIKEGLAYSFFFGFFFFGTVVFWIVNVTALGFFALVTYLSLYAVLFFVLARLFWSKPFSIVTFAALWVILEFLKENIWCGLSWANLGYSQYRNLCFIQTADLFGVKFISFIIVMVNVLICDLIFKNKFKGLAITLRKAAFVSAIIILCFLYSFYRLAQLKETGSLSLSLVQPDVLKEVKHNPDFRSYVIGQLKLSSSKALKDSLLIYPEAAWPEIRSESEFEALASFAKNLNKDILIGAVILEDGKFYNAALYFGAGAKKLDIYRKIKIVPFGEYVPLRNILSFISVLNSLGDISRGSEYKVFSYKEKNFCVLICFEDIFPLFVSRFAKSSDFLINITDDSWFGGEPQASQHLGIMVFRAIENRISIARSANSGISGWVSFRGQINTLRNKGRQTFFADNLNFKLPLNNRRSLYNKWQEVFPFFCFLILAISLLRK